MATPPFVINQAKPADTDVVSQHPADERSARDNIESWLAWEHDATTGYHKIASGNTAARDAITWPADGPLWLNTQESQIEYRTGGTWHPAMIVASPSPAFPAGTKMLFQQTAAPTGWTKDTTHNNKALRVVTGAVSSGGATAFTSVFGSGIVTGGTALTIAQMPAHSHTTLYNMPNNSPGTKVGDLSGGTSWLYSAVATTSVGSGSAHTHTMSMDIQYVDLIIATKD